MKQMEVKQEIARRAEGTGNTEVKLKKV